VYWYGQETDKEIFLRGSGLIHVIFELFNHSSLAAVLPAAVVQESTVLHVALVAVIVFAFSAGPKKTEYKTQ
jgi:hypothetical protein